MKVGHLEEGHRSCNGTPATLIRSPDLPLWLNLVQKIGSKGPFRRISWLAPQFLLGSLHMRGRSAEYSIDKHGTRLAGLYIFRFNPGGGISLSERYVGGPCVVLGVKPHLGCSVTTTLVTPLSPFHHYTHINRRRWEYLTRQFPRWPRCTLTRPIPFICNSSSSPTARSDLKPDGVLTRHPDFLPTRKSASQFAIMAGKPEIFYTDSTSNVDVEPSKSDIFHRGDVNDHDQLLKLGKKPVLKVRNLSTRPQTNTWQFQKLMLKNSPGSAISISGPFSVLPSLSSLPGRRPLFSSPRASRMAAPAASSTRTSSSGPAT